MKKILITMLSAAAMVAGVSSSFAQGQVTFNNSAATAITLTDGTTTAKMFGSAGTFDVGLYLGAAGSSNLTQMTLVSVGHSPNATTGTAFNAGVMTAGNVTLAGIAAGTQYAELVAVWSASSGADYASALASGTGYVGLSALGFITPQVSPATLPVVFGINPGQIGGIACVLQNTPEPATIALGGLGAAALLMFRRRK